MHSETHLTTRLSLSQSLCRSLTNNFFVASAAMANEPDDPGEAGLWTKAERERRALSAEELAERINGIAKEAGDPTRVYQQILWKYEQGKNKKKPAWTRFIHLALLRSDAETKEDPYLSAGRTDDSVGIRLLPTFVGLGDGGTGEGDEGIVHFSRDLIERELRAPADSLLAMVAEGNSMEPEFRGGDQILVDTRRKSLAQPGAFCLWDGDGHVVKYLEKVPDSDPPKVRVVSANNLYEVRERLLDEINLVGRVVWFGRRVQ